MNPKIKKRWVDELRSGKYPQGKGQLKDGNGNYCCLGVLCEIHREETGGEWKDDSYLNRNTVLHYSVVEWARLPDENPKCGGSSLAFLNDNGKTFTEIADIIEKEL